MNIPQTQSAGSLRQQIGRFFYREEVPYGLALVRIFLPLVLLGAMLPRWPHAREIYSTDGATAPLWFNYGFPGLLPEVGGGMAVALHTVLIFCLITTSIGWCTRFSLIVSTVLYVYLNLLDSVSTITKYSCIASHALLLLSFSQCGAIWSVDSWLKRTGRRSKLWPGAGSGALPRGSAAPRRLMQMMIGFVYFGAAITKMHTPEFFSGDQLMAWMMTNLNFDHPFGNYLAMHPALLIIFGYITITWEMLFLFLAWKGWGRAVMLTIGVGFHIMTTLTLGLYIFPLVCGSIYFAFLNEHDVQQIARVWRRFNRRLGWVRERVDSLTKQLPAFRAPQSLRVPSPVLFGFTLVLVAMGGVEAEYRRDPYGVRRPEGPYALKELDPGSVKEMLTPTPKLRDKDIFFSLDVGTILVGDVLLNRRREFRAGEKLIAQCSISPPHDDMWVECNLHDAHDRVIDRSGQVISREMLRSNFVYHLTNSLEPGEYYLVLKKGGQEITRRKITLHSGEQSRGVSSPLAN